MEYAEHAVPAALRRHLECVWTLGSGGRPAPAEAGAVLPDGAVEVVVGFGGPIDRPGGPGGPARLLVGPLDRPVRVRYRGPVDLVAARLRPAAARSVTAVPLWRLRGRVVPLGAVAPTLDAALAEACGRAGAAPGARIRAVIGAFAAELARGRAVDPIVEEAVRDLARAAGRVGVADLAASLGVHPRWLQRRFRDFVGLSPGALARVLRFRRAWEAMPDAPRRGWATIALEAGYADQPHLIREFRAFTGTSPGRLARTPRMRDRSGA
jgi:AraC-like DNA-binding protein